MTVRKAERLINLTAYLLETTKPVTAKEIQRTIPGYSENWQSFLRTFERDKDELREMGLPLEFVPTPDPLDDTEGYTIPKERYYLPDLELEDDEIAALWLAAGLLRLPDPGAARAALLRLTGEAPAEDDRAQLTWLVADLGLSEPALPRAFHAVAERKRITFPYPSKEGAPKERILDPYGLVHRRGAWYVIGREHENDEVKSFRLDRMLGDLRLVDPSAPGNQYLIPRAFRPEAAIETPPFVQGEALTVANVKFDAATAWRVERGFPWLTLNFADDGSAETEVPVTEKNGFLSWILSFGEGAKVLSPPELVEGVTARLEKICG
jgi:proteasome accessory factor B